MYSELSEYHRCNAYSALVSSLCSDLNDIFTMKCLHGAWKASLDSKRVALLDSFDLSLKPMSFAEEQQSTPESIAEWIIQNYWLFTIELSKVSIHISAGMFALNVFIFVI